MFKGTIRLGDGDADGLATTLTADSGRLVIVAGAHEIGNWAIEDLSVKRRDDEFFIKVEGEELVVAVADPVGLSEALGIKDRTGKPRRPGTSKRKRKQRSQPEASPQTARPAIDRPAATAFTPLAPAVNEVEPAREGPSLWSRLSQRQKLAGMGLIILVVIGALAPGLLALLLLLAGMLTLFLGIAARNDSGTSVLPPAFFATTTAAAGGIGMVLLAVLIIAVT